jgi:hypothetical protein
MRHDRRRLGLAIAVNTLPTGLQMSTAAPSGGLKGGPNLPIADADFTPDSAGEMYKASDGRAAMLGAEMLRPTKNPRLSSELGWPLIVG